MNKRLAILTVLFLAGPIGCQQKAALDIDDYRHWLLDPSNGLTQTQTVGDIKLVVTLLPQEYRAYQDREDNPHESNGNVAEIIQRYDHSVAFLVTISPETESDQGDVLKRGVMNYGEFAERTYSANFNMAEHLTLNANGNEYTPVLVTMDNDYGMGSARRFTVIFVDENDPDSFEGAKTMDFRFLDELFGTGVTHFTIDNTSQGKYHLFDTE